MLIDSRNGRNSYFVDVFASESNPVGPKHSVVGSRKFLYTYYLLLQRIIGKVVRVSASGNSDTIEPPVQCVPQDVSSDRVSYNV